MFKESIIRTFTTMATLFTLSMLINGIEIKIYTSILLLSILLAILQTLTKYILFFLTIPVNVLTIFTTESVFTIIIIYFFKLFIPGYEISDGYIGPFLNDSINIPLIQMKSYIVILIIALSISCMNILINWALNKK